MHLHPSIKSDYYLSLCLEQASLSPLTFRHGSVIVKGGKVIGAGFNDYRPGFNGGTLKTGALNSHATSSTASTTTNATAALSMHSEMMAIHSALGVKATATRGLRPFLPMASAKQSRLVVEEYAEAVLRAAGPPRGRPASMAETAEGPVWRFEGTSRGLTQCEASSHFSTDSDELKSDGNRPARHQHGSRAASRTSSKYSRNRSASPLKDHDPNFCSGRRPKVKRDLFYRKQHSRLAGADLYVARLKKSGSCHLKTQRADMTPPVDLGPKASGVDTAHVPAFPTGSLHDELLIKYANVTRAASASSSPAGDDPTATASKSAPTATASKSAPTATASKSAPTATASKSAPTATASKSAPLGRVAESRPCYRCITYMHSVGIKRVFWTNSEGVWEGAKVRDLVDSLEAAARDGSGNGPGSDVGGMFVTKHEVLLLLRTLPEGGT
ncbi:hypothetical protein SEPCBS119000_004858 [Sporothrix epigloea]|uniref:CMP/dCMP-type deaminase domain-containing protein n=1 Tax=Sporothrix epigloea TaxID=1892477 RepID=A0ABP0DUF7_9PEZI